MLNRKFRTGDDDIDNIIHRIEKLEQKVKDCKNLPLIKAIGHAEERLAAITKKLLLRKKNLMRLKEEMDSIEKRLAKIGCKP